MSVRQLSQEMGSQEFFEWMAHDSIDNDTDYKDKLTKEIALEKSAKQSVEQRADEIASMFRGLTGK
jgi:hypothetical protein